MSRTKFTVLPHDNPPLGLPNKYGLLESLDSSFPYTVFCTKKAWLTVLERVNLAVEEKLAREREVLQSDLPESILELDHMVAQSHIPPNRHKI